MLKGVTTALVTPFLDNKIDYNSLEKLLENQIKASVSAIVLFGSTGEGMNIEQDEYENTVKIVSDFISNSCSGIKLFVGASSTSTSRILKFCDMVMNNGGHGVLLSSTPYNKPTQDGIFEIFSMVSEMGVPFIVYNIPSRAGVDIAHYTMKKIALLPNIVGIKESSGDIKRIIGLDIDMKNRNVNVLCGDDYMFLSAMVHGANGIISVASNIIPKIMKKIYNFCIQNDYVSAKELYNKVYHIFNSLYCQINPIPIKFATRYINLIKSDFLRSPLRSINDIDMIDTLSKDVDLVMEIEDSI